MKRYWLLTVRVMCWLSHMLLGRSYLQKGKLPEAVAEFEKAAKIENSIPEVLAALGHG